MSSHVESTSLQFAHKVPQHRLDQEGIIISLHDVAVAIAAEETVHNCRVAAHMGLCKLALRVTHHACLTVSLRLLYMLSTLLEVRVKALAECNTGGNIKRLT